MRSFHLQSIVRAAALSLSALPLALVAGEPASVRNFPVVEASSRASLTELRAEICDGSKAVPGLSVGLYRTSDGAVMISATVTGVTTEDGSAWGEKGDAMRAARERAEKKIGAYVADRFITSERVRATLKLAKALPGAASDPAQADEALVARLVAAAKKAVVAQEGKRDDGFMSSLFKREQFALTTLEKSFEPGFDGKSCTYRIVFARRLDGAASTTAGAKK